MIYHPNGLKQFKNLPLTLLLFCSFSLLLEKLNIALNIFSCVISQREESFRETPRSLVTNRSKS